MNDKTKKFNHISEASLSLVSRDIAWQLSNSVAWKIGMAAKSQKQLDDDMIALEVEEPIAVVRG